MATATPSIEEALEGTRKALRRGDVRVALVGPEGAGKSTVLERLAADWPRKGPPPILVRVPKTIDGALTAAAQVGAKLFPARKDLEKKLRSLELSFSQKVDAICDVIAELGAPLLVEDVAAATGGDIWLDAFDIHRRDFVERLMQLDTPLVYTSTRRPRRPGDVEVHIERRSNATVVLAKDEWTGKLAKVARQLLEEGGEKLRDYSPLELRLAVLVAESTGVGRVLSQGWRLTELLDHGFARLGGAASDQLKATATRLALIREPLDKDWIDWALGPSPEPSVRSTLYQVLLFEEGGAWHLHESIGAQATKKQSRWLSRGEVVAAHQQLAKRYRGWFKTAADEGDLERTLRCEMELVHHLTEAGDASLLTDSLVFIEQYDLLGRTLSLEGIDRLKRKQVKEGRALLGKSNKAYSRALEHNPSDAYALHYRAFNRDVLADDPDEVGEAYEQAIEARPDWVWSHSRFLKFLVTTGRYTEFRVAWENARSALMPNGTADDMRLYDELHCDVARVLLHFGQLGPTKAVLNDVPRQLKDRLHRFELLLEMVRTHEEVERNELVFPPWVSEEERWAHPHLVPASERTNVKSWHPGCVAHRAAQHTRFRIASLVDGAPRFEWDEVPNAQLAELAGNATLAKGAFVEFVTRSDGTEQLVADRPAGERYEPIEVRFPDPERYLDSV